MRVIALKRLREHWETAQRQDSEQPLKAWHAVARRATWRHFADVKAQFRSASAVGDRVVFNIAGNKYRLVTFINYDYHTIYIRFIGTHSEYDKLDVKDV
jgi:mRNA interferase HigB